jgi:hypothetical protein
MRKIRATDRRAFVVLREDAELRERHEFEMIQLVEFLTPVFALGFMAGYGARSLVSLRRRTRGRG